MTAPMNLRAWSLDLAPEDWLVIPAHTDDPWTTATVERVRAALTSEAFGEDSPADARIPDLIRTVATDAVQRLCELADTVAPDETVVAALGVTGRTPVPVIVTVAAIDEHDPVDLLDVCGARQGRSFDAPDVEYFDVPGGDGIRVTRTDVGRDAVAWMSVSLAVRTELADTVIRWRTTDLALVPEMTERLSVLLAGVRLHPDPEGQQP